MIVRVEPFDHFLGGFRKITIGVKDEAYQARDVDRRVAVLCRSLETPSHSKELVEGIEIVV